MAQIIITSSPENSTLLAGARCCMSFIEKLQQSFQCCAPKPAVVDVKLTRPAVTPAPEPSPAPATEPPPLEATPAKPPNPEPPTPKVKPPLTQPQAAKPKAQPAPAKKMASLVPDAVALMKPESVIETMKNGEYMANAELMGAACKQLRVLCREDDNCMVCDQLGAAQYVFQAMNMHINVPAVQQQACAALINLCAGESFDRRDRAAKSGALKAIVQAMKIHLEYPGIQEMAFVAIQNICFGNDINGLLRKEQAIEEGAFGAIVTAIKKHEDTASVLDQGAATLRLLADKKPLRKAQAIEVGAKSDWLKSSGGISARVGGLTSRMFGRSPGK